MAPSEHLQEVQAVVPMPKSENRFVGKRTGYGETTAKKSTYFQLSLALVFSIFWLGAGGLRTEEIGHDFRLYVDQVRAYYTPSDIRFPDLVFHSTATIVTMVLDQFGLEKALAARIFFLTIAFVQAILLFMILRHKKPAEIFIIAIGFGPLMFLDIIRQGLAMLFAGAFFVQHYRNKVLLLLLAFATHVSSIVSIGAFDLRKVTPAAMVGAAGIILMLSWFLIDDLTARYVWYSSHEGYLRFEDTPDIAVTQFSYFNAIVLLFFLGSTIAGFLSRQEGVILILLYMLSMALPLFFRTYLFYLFVMTCSRDVFVRKWSVASVLFNIGYAILVLRMAPLAFVETEAVE